MDRKKTNQAELKENVANEIMQALIKNFTSSRQYPKKQKNREINIYDQGAVWHGDWAYKADIGSFGKGSGKEHFAMITGNKRVKHKKPGVKLAPITSKNKSKRKCVFLPGGELKTNKKKDGYIVPSVRLIIRKSKLKVLFEFIQLLDKVYVNKCLEVIRNG